MSYKVSLQNSKGKGASDKYFVFERHLKTIKNLPRQNSESEVGYNRHALKQRLDISGQKILAKISPPTAKDQGVTLVQHVPGTVGFHTCSTGLHWAKSTMAQSTQMTDTDMLMSTKIAICHRWITMRIRNKATEVLLVAIPRMQKVWPRELSRCWKILRLIIRQNTHTNYFDFISMCWL